MTFRFHLLFSHCRRTSCDGSAQGTIVGEYLSSTPSTPPVSSDLRWPMALLGSRETWFLSAEQIVRAVIKRLIAIQNFQFKQEHVCHHCKFAQKSWLISYVFHWKLNVNAEIWPKSSLSEKRKKYIVRFFAIFSTSKDLNVSKYTNMTNIYRDRQRNSERGSNKSESQSNVFTLWRFIGWRFFDETKIS